MSAPLLQVQRLRAALPDARPVLRGVDLVVAAGEVHGLVGESGGGKTMLARAVAGVLPEGVRVTAGRIGFAGQDVLTLPPAQRRALLGRSIAMILQNPSAALNPVLRVERQLAEVLRAQGLSKPQARDAALEWLERVQIREPARVLGQYPDELSGGMCQRIVIAMAFACQPQLIIADEPTTALDVTVQLEVLRLIRRLQRETGVAVLFVTHDLGVVAKLCDRMSVLFAGRVLEGGSVAEVFARPAHPYTAALLAAMPRYDEPERGLHPVPPALIEQLWAETAEADRAAAA
jgi:peptide/nickel transport system ATP-binding protein